MIALNPDRPATYVVSHLLRDLATNRGDHLKTGDGMDFCHAVLGLAYGSLATVDRVWKARLTRAIPSMSGLAKLYYRPETGDLVNDLERLTASAP